MKFSVSIDDDRLFTLEEFAYRMQKLSEDFPEAKVSYVSLYADEGGDDPSLSMTLKYEDA